MTTETDSAHRQERVAELEEALAAVQAEFSRGEWVSAGYAEEQRQRAERAEERARQAELAHESLLLRLEDLAEVAGLPVQTLTPAGVLTGATEHQARVAFDGLEHIATAHTKGEAIARLLALLAREEHCRANESGEALTQVEQQRDNLAMRVQALERELGVRKETAGC